MQLLSVLVEPRQAARNLLQIAMLLLGCCLATFGQEATIVGTVAAPSGSVVPVVTITVTHTGTGQTRTLATNDAGQYVAPDLVIGNDDVKAEAPGFKATEKKNIVLNVNDRTRIDFVMQMGAVQESVTVEASALAVQSDSVKQRMGTNRYAHFAASTWLCGDYVKWTLPLIGSTNSLSL